MKITENQLKQIIDEEIQTMVDNGEIDEGMLDRLKARGSSALSKAGSAVKGAGQSLGAKYTGAKAAGAEFLGGDVKKLRGQHDYLATPKSRSWIAAGKSVRIRNLKISGLKTKG